MTVHLHVRPQDSKRRTSGPRLRRTMSFTAAATMVMGVGVAVCLTPVSPANAAVTTYGLFNDATVPSVLADSDTANVTLGTVFTSRSNGSITAIRYYKSAPNTGPHTGQLWAGNGSLLATAKFLNETISGWQTATLSQPVSVKSGITYVTSYTAPAGRYSIQQNRFSSGKTVVSGVLTATKGVYKYGGGYPNSSWNGSNYYVDVLYSSVSVTPPSSSVPSDTAPIATTTSVSLIPPTSSSLTPTATVTSSSPAAPSSGFPGAANTGVPEGTTLSGYTGPCTITVANTVIDRKAVGCDVVIKAAGVKITNSSINGRLVSNSGGSVSVTDSLINGGAQETFPSVSYENLSLLRVEVIGGQHSVQCSANCTVQDSWLHGQYIGAGSPGHVNAFISNGGSNFKLIHNTLHCTVQPTSVQGGCTADASLFGDFGPIANAVFDRNLFKANSTGAGYCLQAGYNPSKAYPNPTGVVVTNNVFERGGNNKCGIYGPVTAFLKTAPGAGWSNNTFADGAVINP
jgi:hypothetical protein